MYVDEMWLECVQGRAMQDVLAAKQRKKTPPRRALAPHADRPEAHTHRAHARRAARRAQVHGARF